MCASCCRRLSLALLLCNYCQAFSVGLTLWLLTHMLCTYCPAMQHLARLALLQFAHVVLSYGPLSSQESHPRRLHSGWLSPLWCECQLRFISALPYGALNHGCYYRLNIYQIIMWLIIGRPAGYLVCTSRYCRLSL